MARSRLWTAVVMCTLLLAFPRTGSAGLWDFIVEMSGPRMMGVGYECRLMFDGEWESCKVSGGMSVVARNVPTDKIWLSLGGNYFWSVKAEVNGHRYGWWDVQMLAFDPILEIESKSWPRCAEVQGKRECDNTKIKPQIYHGILGMSYNVLWGVGEQPAVGEAQPFSTFSNIGLKLRPIGVVIPVSDRVGLDFSYDLRLYPRRFTAEDFGRTPLEAEGNGAEAVHAFVFGLRIKRK